MKKLSLVLLSVLFSITSCSNKNNNEAYFNSDLEIEKVTSLKDDFIKGMDISSLISLEQSGVSFYDLDNKKKDLLLILKNHGLNYIRVRIWNDPYDHLKNGYGGGNCDLNKALEIGKRATKVGLKLFIDFHYSDFWADPGKQMAPKAWKDYSLSQKEEAMYEFTLNSLKELKKENIDVGIVSIGNEINSGIAGETLLDNQIRLIKKGIKAVRDFSSSIQVALHYTNPEKEGLFKYYSDMLNEKQVDYDIFSTSYYPYYHGTLDNLINVLSYVSATYNKKVMVSETSYCYTSEDSDYFANSVSSTTDCDKPYDFSLQGQATHVRNVIDVVNQIPNGIGVFYWEGAWISVGGSSYQENKQKWEEFGSGWASSFSKEYDPEDAGKYYGGSAVDNQTFFDSKGHVLESLKVFNLV